MNNRPPTPDEVIAEPWTEYCKRKGRDVSGMQEALTCEWLIEQGLMPDPTEYLQQGFVVFRHGEFTMPAVRIDWRCEDKTK